jgi:hypothetical protein
LRWFCQHASQKQRERTTYRSMYISYLLQIFVLFCQQFEQIFLPEMEFRPKSAMIYAFMNNERYEYQIPASRHLWSLIQLFPDIPKHIQLKILTSFFDQWSSKSPQILGYSIFTSTCVSTSDQEDHLKFFFPQSLQENSTFIFQRFQRKEYSKNR